MIVNCNGNRISIEARQLAEALVLLGFENRPVVVAVNETFVPKDEWPTFQINTDDRLDVLSAIEGG